MVRWAHDDVLDGTPNYIKDNCDKQVVCSDPPTTYAEAVSLTLAEVAMSSTDFTVEDGDTDGRKCVVAAKSGVLITASGEFDHTALLDTVNSKLLYVVPGTAQTLTANGSNTVDIPSYDVANVRDPTAP